MPKKFSKDFVAFLEAAGLAFYVVIFAIVVQNAEAWLPARVDNPLIGMSSLLLVFVFSALLSGSLLLGYPIHLFLDGKRKEAAIMVLQSALWLVFFVAYLFLIGTLAR